MSALRGDLIEPCKFLSIFNEGGEGGEDVSSCGKILNWDHRLKISGDPFKAGMTGEGSCRSVP